MQSEDLIYLTYLNGKETALKEIQEEINRARRKYFDVNEIQLHLDRRQEALDTVMKRVMDEKEKVISPN